MKDFDPWRLTLDGTTLIEASAGTGKTYTLTTLYLRLLVEEDLLPSQILVVTYTHAATAELRERVRSRIQEAIAAGEEIPAARVDPQLRGWVRAARVKCETDGRPDPLRRALREFDEAAIFTIHGFCQRTLQENAFESGVAFDAELVEDDTAPLRVLANDLWARLLNGEAPEFVEWLRHGAGSRWKFEPDELHQSLLKKLGADEELPVLPASVAELGSFDLVSLRKQAQESWLRWARVWRAREEKVRGLLLGENDLNKNKYKQDTIATKWIPQLDEWAARMAAGEDAACMNAVELPKWWSHLTTEGIADGVKKNGRAIADPCFAAFSEVRSRVECLETARRARALGLRVRFVEAAREEARRRREERHILFFDDLLSELRAALRPPEGDRLVELLRDRYRFALIDEFQDTDPVQYEIFRRVWHASAREIDRGGLVLIGDPKQAIYSFRGADVFTYLEAREDANGEAIDLRVNWRSNMGLIAAVNALFGRSKNALGLDRIEFHPMVARPDAEAQFAVPNRSGAGLRVLLADRRVAGELLGAPVEKELPLRFGRTDLMDAMARDIADLLDAGAQIGRNPLNPSHIAVLCRRKGELARARRALEALGIPCVDRGDSDVFDSREAWEFVSVLRAMLRSGNPALLRGALSTGAHGLDAAEIAELGDDASELAAVGERYSEYARIWAGWGFGRAISAWRRAEGVTERLLGFEDGERRLTNWLHLAELLQRVDADRTLSRMGLVAWLERMIATPEARGEVGSEVSLLRLERDDRAVSLVTLHRSKGLEYEIVYLPSLWEDPSARGASVESAQDESKQSPPVRYFDEDRGRRTLDLGGPDIQRYAKHVEQGMREAMSEELRLLYVGLTRAKRQCVVVWGAIGRAYAKTPLAWLLHAREWQADGKDRASSPAALKSWTDDDWRAAWQAMADAAGEGAISIETPRFEPRARWQAARAVGPPLAFEMPRCDLGLPVLTTSFSALTRNAERDREPLSGPHVTGRDRDAGVLDAATQMIDEAPDLAAGMHEFPRGAEAGTLLHEILEQVDFANYDESRIRVLVAKVIEANSFEPGHLDRIMHVVASVAHTPFRVAPAPNRLAALARGQLRPEIEFTLSARGGARHERFSPTGLATLLLQTPAESPLHCYADRVSRMSWRELNGYLRGFIDAVFFDGQRYYLIDYKSNYLGARQVDYAPDRLLQPMLDHDYVLQYLIYSVALDRHLAQRIVDYDYEVHFGGAYYLFLRGLAQSHPPGCGVFFDRPGAEVVRGASRLLGEIDPPRRMS